MTQKASENYKSHQMVVFIISTSSEFVCYGAVSTFLAATPFLDPVHDDDG
jgi:hypothetical protein